MAYVEYKIKKKKTSLKSASHKHRQFSQDLLKCHCMFLLLFRIRNGKLSCFERVFFLYSRRSTY